jgi:hypothetical protein
MAARARAAGQDRHDPTVQLWGLLVLMESRLRVDAGDPAIAAWVEEADQLGRQNVARIDVVRAQVAAARFHLAGGRPADAWRAIRTAADLAGPGPSFASYTLEAHAGLPEVCLALLERGEPPRCGPGRAARDRRRRPAPAAPLCPLLPHGPAQGAGLPGLVALAPGPPWRSPPGLDAGHPGGRAARHALGAGQRPPRAGPPSGCWPALSTRPGPDRAPRPGQVDRCGARLPHRPDRANRGRRPAYLNVGPGR